MQKPRKDPLELSCPSRSLIIAAARDDVVRWDRHVDRRLIHEFYFIVLRIVFQFPVHGFWVDVTSASRTMDNDFLKIAAPSQEVRHQHQHRDD